MHRSTIFQPCHEETWCGNAGTDQPAPQQTNFIKSMIVGCPDTKTFWIS